MLIGLLIFCVAGAAQNNSLPAEHADTVDGVIGSARQCVGRGDIQLGVQKFREAYETYGRCIEIIGTRYADETMKDDTGMRLAFAKVEALKKRYPQAAELARSVAENRLRVLEATFGAAKFRP